MRFMAGDPEVPVLVRLARNLLLTQAGLLLLGGVYLLLARAFTGATGTVGGGIGIGTLAAVYLALAFVVVVIGINVSRLAAWARYAALLLEVILLAYLTSQAVQRRGSSVIGALLALVIIGLLLSPRTARAFAVAASERPDGGAPAAPPLATGAARASIPLSEPTARSAATRDPEGDASDG